MAFAPKRMAGPTQATTASVAYYTPTTGVLPAVVKEFLLTNNTTSDGTIRFGIGGVNSSQLIVPETFVVAKSTSAAVDNLVVLAFSTVLETTSDVIYAQADAASRVTFTISGEESSG